jgi:hypothetical protein
MVSELTREEVAALDSGIAGMVLHLRDNGFETTDSGDGVSKPAEWYASGEALPFPHVFVRIDHRRIVGEARRMRALLAREWRVEASYDPDNDIAILMAIGPTPAKEP